MTNDGDKRLIACTMDTGKSACIRAAHIKYITRGDRGVAIVFLPDNHSVHTRTPYDEFERQWNEAMGHER